MQAVPTQDARQGMQSLWDSFLLAFPEKRVSYRRATTAQLE